jgi:hypothetical protein
MNTVFVKMSTILLEKTPKTLNKYWPVAAYDTYHQHDAARNNRLFLLK